ncbi:hypothetical protein HKX48_000765 [Thoreauomyces humboldtii]|nr:hypothetical protein HKX48_000765 [Thoreauomyces humboldtii]
MVNVDEEVELLKREIKRLGKEDPSNGTWVVPFGVLVKDDACANIFEALVGTLRAAKKRKVVTYDAEILLQGHNLTHASHVRFPTAHDNVNVILLPQPSSS